MKKLLFIPQNPEHVSNMLPVSEALDKYGYHTDYLDISKIYGQILNLPKKPISFVSFDQSATFYKNGFYSRVKVLRRVTSEIVKIVSKYDAFVYGNDGRLVYYYFIFVDDEGIGSTQIDRDIACQKVKKTHFFSVSSVIVCSKESY